MEFTLRCNVLKCRTELSDHAVVTTCGHIFCLNCSNQCQLSGQRDGQRPVCPACDMQLANPDDVVATNLKPTEDYKTSVLSGLRPFVVMEIAGRALSFWAYQAAQEIVYQEYLAKNLTEKYASLSAQWDKIIHDANTEISTLREKVSNMQNERDDLRKKNSELVQSINEKTRICHKTQEQYDKLKRRSFIGQVKNAASAAVEDTIQASGMGNRYIDKVNQSHNQGQSENIRPNQNQNERPPPPLFSQQPGGIQYNGGSGDHGNNTITQPGHAGNGEQLWAGLSSQVGNFRHRPSPRIGLVNLPRAGISSTPMQALRRISPRQPLAGLSTNNNGTSGFAGYGMSAGLKVSHPSGVPVTGSARPVVRARVAQRSGSAGYPPVGRVTNFGTSATPNMFSNGHHY